MASMPAAPDAVEFSGRYSDGRSAAQVDAWARIEGDSLILRAVDGSELLRDRLDHVRLIDAPQSDAQGRIALGPEHMARFSFFSRELHALLRAAAPQLRADPYASAATGRRVLTAAVVAVASVALLVLVVVPLLARQIAQITPPAWAARAGRWISEEVIAHFSRRGGVCESPSGVAALQRLAQPLMQQARTPLALNIRVVDSATVNALALPGGQILILRGLIDNARDPGEVAGVLAHEIAHVELRHVTELFYRRSATSFIIGLVFGDVAGFSTAGFLAQTLIGARYSREAEEAADTRAFELLGAAGLASSGFADFFERMARVEGGAAELLAYVSTHPPSAQRAQRARAAARGGGRALDDAGWRDLRAICG
jgi:Zn-dependent protease with chaperone function